MNRKKMETLKETTNSMVESTKHCIVLLQIAKDTINPVDAIYQPSPLEPVISTMPSQIVLLPEPVQLCKLKQQRPSSLPVGPVLATLGQHQTPTPNTTGSGHSLLNSSLTSPSHVNLSPNTVPEFSYSTSEDEFYDANEFHQTGSSPKHWIDSSGSASVLTHRSLDS
ncbi:oxysterol-binding protein-related protein 9-like [Symphalangus syndactylus]|uniref:oxysterol-binding protein-related protein 9-like n=1 Tax=Symphalangus syndactylus TaxID=9590 RepID=UPI0024419BB9|nr:oxysterol-binding protein-related protein 9-like [Symphalangus syndactylus]